MMTAPLSPNNAFSISNTARKLPIKRKSQTQPSPPPPPPTLTPIHHEAADEDDDDDDQPSPPDTAGRSGSYQYNRLWSEADEITFLRALLHSRSDGYRFPRDMPRFYDRFRESMTGSYTRTQFSEKLRRLRKKFRHVSGRVRRHGAAEALKTSHEKVVYELSHRLWGDVAANEAAEESDSKEGSDIEASAGRARPPETIVVIRHEPSSAPPSSRTVLPPASVTPLLVIGGDSQQGGGGGSELDEAVGRVTAETVIGVLEESIKDARMVMVGRVDDTGEKNVSRGRGRKRNLKMEWAKQQIAEFDVLSQRLRLVVETAVSNLRNSRGPANHG